MAGKYATGIGPGTGLGSLSGAAAVEDPGGGDDVGGEILAVGAPTNGITVSVPLGGILVGPPVR